MKTILIYESTHHENTKKLVDAVAKRYGIRTATVEEAATMDLSAYDKDVFFLERLFFPLYLRK